MYDKELVIDIFNKIQISLEQIERRFSGISFSEDFIRNETGLEKLDSICMQLINIGEGLKQIDKLTESGLLKKYQEIDWKKAKGMRDIITHHYFDIDYEVVFKVCSEKLPEMYKVTEKILNDIQQV